MYIVHPLHRLRQKVTSKPAEVRSKQASKKLGPYRVLYTTANKLTIDDGGVPNAVPTDRVTIEQDDADRSIVGATGSQEFVR